MKRVVSFLVCLCLACSVVACGGSAPVKKAEYVPVNADVLWGTELNGYKAELLSWAYTADWKSNADEPGTPSILLRFYFENDNHDPLYLLESFAISLYQDGKELSFISLNSDTEECLNAVKEVKDGASLFCEMAFAAISDSAAELRVTEPTAEANLLLEKTLIK